MVYLDNAATTKPYAQVVEKMRLIDEQVWGNPSSIHYAGRDASEFLDNARKAIAKCIGSSKEEVYFTSGGLESNTQAIMSAIEYGQKTNRKIIICSPIEHHSVLHALDYAISLGFEVYYIPIGTDGIIDPQIVESMINLNVCLVSVMAVNNEIGTIQPIEEIGELCRKNKVLFHVDAVQAVGHIPMNFHKVKADYLTFSAHKFHGPKGTGVLCVSKKAPLSSLIFGGGQEQSKRGGTENLPGIVGASLALKLSCDSIQENTLKVTHLRNKLISGLEQRLEGVQLNGSLISRVPGNVNITFKGVEGESLVILLDSCGICASTGSACNSVSLEPSHVLKAIGLSNESALCSVRFSIDESNTDEEINYAILKIVECVNTLRKMKGTMEV